MTASSKEFAPNLDAAERSLAHASPDAAQVILLRAGMLDICMLLRDIRTSVELMTKNLQRAARSNGGEQGL